MSALLAAGLLLLTLAWYRPGWLIFFALSVAALLDLFQIGIGGVDFGVNLYIDDVACVLVMGTGLLMLMRYRTTLPRDAVPCLALLVLVALSFGRGVGPFGLKVAGNGSRNLFFFVAPALAIMLLRPAFRLDAGRLARWLGWAGLSLSAVALLRWGGVLPIPADLVEGDFREVVRSLNADYAFIVGLAFIAAIWLPLIARRSAWWWVGAGMLGGVTLALQHRSVWVATAAGLVWLGLRSLQRLYPLRWLAVGAAVCVGLGVIVVAIPQVLESAGMIVTTNVQEVESRNSTWAWRVAGYEEATDRLFSSQPADILIGPPAGWAADLMREHFASTAIHSRYVSTLAFYGIVGSIALLLWFGMLAKRIGWPTRSPRGRPARDHAGSILLEALFLSELVYMVPYSGGILESAVLGLIWVAATQNNISIGAERVAVARYQFHRGSKLVAQTS
jgi:hypothetical protein